MNSLLLIRLFLFSEFIQKKYLHYTITGLLIISIGLVIGIFYFGNLRAAFRKKKNGFKEKINSFISDSILQSMDGEKNVSLPQSSIQQLLLKNQYARQIMINELLWARKNFSGSAGESIQLLYEQLALDKDSKKKLDSYKWHYKAKGIQELSIMNQQKHWKKIYALTNHRNEHIRREAQAGIIQLLGFVGLRFLNVAIYPITLWQQINLLQLISQFPQEEFKGQEQWLESSNISVVIFALKLVANFRRYELHNKVKSCLQHPVHNVRIEAVKTLGEIYQEDTYQYIIHSYTHDTTLSFRLEALESLGKIGTEEATSFLSSQLYAEEVKIKIAAARALLKSSSTGMALLQEQIQIGNTQWHTIIAQLKHEMCI